MTKKAICTIICTNYIAYARTQYESIRSLNISDDYYVFIVDGSDSAQFNKETFNTIMPSQLYGEKEYKNLAFRFNALELSTNVKPALLKYLFSKGYEEIYYFDPDIYIYSSIDCISTELGKNSLLLTPHTIQSYDDNCRPSEIDLLKGGVFNLGFIGLKNTKEANRFLDWWEKRCLKLGYREANNGLMVDQKWVNLVPCYFEGVKISKNVGYNVAYWNLHERKLINRNGIWYVNDRFPLIFYHFSGIGYEHSDQISKYQNRYDLKSFKELAPLYEKYRSSLINNGISSTINKTFKYDKFDDGTTVTDIARKLFYTYADKINDDPFSSKSKYYKWLKKNGMVGFAKTNESYNSMNYNVNDIRIKIIHKILKLLLSLFGADRYLMLMKYLNYITIIRNQSIVFPYTLDGQ